MLERQPMTGYPSTLFSSRWFCDIPENIFPCGVPYKPFRVIDEVLDAMPITPAGRLTIERWKKYTKK